MSTTTAPERPISSTADRRRQLEESTEAAMEQYRNQVDQVRAKTARLKALREAAESKAKTADAAMTPAQRLAAKRAAARAK